MSSSRSACHSKAKSFSFGVGIGDLLGAVKSPNSSLNRRKFGEGFQSPEIWIFRWMAGNSEGGPIDGYLKSPLNYRKFGGVQSTEIWKVRKFRGRKLSSRFESPPVGPIWTASVSFSDWVSSNFPLRFRRSCFARLRNPLNGKFPGGKSPPPMLG